MSRPLSDQFRGCYSFLVLAVNTVFWCSLLYVIGLLKLLVRNRRWHIFCGRVSNLLAQGWVGVNSLGLDITKNIGWDIRGVDGLRPDGSYLLLANHQSMVDIAVLQYTFHRRTPPLKFFLKKELIWVPVIGIAWWALDFPFMKRSGSARKDLETTRKACEKFKLVPVTVMNFVEGTRFSESKRVEQNSPFNRLLKPKSGGIGVVLDAMGEELNSVIDVTIVYPDGVPGMWEFLCGKSLEVKVRVKQIPITSELRGDQLSDREFRRRFNDWLNALWVAKDKLIEAELHSPAPGAERSRTDVER